MAAPYPACEEVEPQAAAIEEVETRLSKLGKSKPVDLSAFSWLQWSPPTDSKCGQVCGGSPVARTPVLSGPRARADPAPSPDPTQTLSRCFPGALPGPAVVARTKVLEKLYGAPPPAALARHVDRLSPPPTPFPWPAQA